MRSKSLMHVQLAAAAALLVAVERGDVEVRYKDEVPRREPLFDPRELHALAIEPPKSRGPAPRRKYPVRR